MTKRKAKDGKVYENATISFEIGLLEFITAQAAKLEGGNRSKYVSKILEEQRRMVEKKENGSHANGHKK